MPVSASALRLSIIVGADDVWQHTPVHHEIVRRAHDAGLAGATVLRGSEGFGSSRLIHTNRLLSLTEGLPVPIVVVDEEERIRAFLPTLDDLLDDATVLLDEVEVVRYGKRARR